MVWLKSFRKKGELAKEIDKNNISAYYLKNVYSYKKGLKWSVKKIPEIEVYYNWEKFTNKKGYKEDNSYQKFRINWVIKINNDSITIFDNKIFEINNKNEIIWESEKYKLLIKEGVIFIEKNNSFTELDMDALKEKYLAPELEEEYGVSKELFYEKYKTYDIAEAYNISIKDDDENIKSYLRKTDLFNFWLKLHFADTDTLFTFFESSELELNDKKSILEWYIWATTNLDSIIAINNNYPSVLKKVLDDIGYTLSVDQINVLDKIGILKKESLKN